MPAKTKLSTRQRALELADEDKGLMITCKKDCLSDEATVSSNGTRVNNPFMMKPDGTMYLMVKERRSRKVQVMKWRQLNDEVK